jgi:type II secretory pathway pseudopilin PulG
VVELIVALVIAGIVATAITTSLSRLGRARDVARVRMTASRRATDALEHIRRDVQSTLRSDDLFFTRFRLAPEAVSSPIGELDRDQMLLFNERLRSIRPLSYSGEGQEYETQYRIEIDADGASLGRRRDPVPDRHEDAGGLAEPIGDGVVALRFEAYDGAAWRQDWDSDVDGLPLSVRATVTASGERIGEEMLTDGSALVTLRTEIPLDRAPAPKKDPEEETPADGTEDSAAGGAGAAGGAAGGVPAGVGGDAGPDGGGGGGGRGGRGMGNPNYGGRGGPGGRGGQGGGRGGGSVPFIPPPSQNGGGSRSGGGGL